MPLSGTVAYDVMARQPTARGRGSLGTATLDANFTHAPLRLRSRSDSQPEGQDGGAMPISASSTSAYSARRGGAPTEYDGDRCTPNCGTEHAASTGLTGRNGQRAGSCNLEHPGDSPRRRRRRLMDCPECGHSQSKYAFSGSFRERRIAVGGALL